MNGEGKLNETKSKLWFFTVVSAALLSAVVASSAATAQEATKRSADSALEEVVVTAQKREESVQDVGIAITAFTASDIRDFGFQESVDVISLASGVFLSGSTGGLFSQFTIRGVTQSTFADNVESPNAVFIDGAYIASPQGSRFALFDVERIEILKGPQGTLFGRNATGGLIHYITRKPTDEFEGYLDFSYGSYNEIRVEGAVNQPLSQAVSARVSGMYVRHDPILENIFPFGQATNPFTGAPLAGSPAGAVDNWDEDQWAMRGQILWEINEDAKLVLSVYAAEQSVATAPYKSPAVVAFINAAGDTVQSRYARDDDICEAISAETGACVPIFFNDGEVPPYIPGVSPLFPGNEDAVRPVAGGDIFGFRDSDIGKFQTAQDQSAKDANVFKSHGVTATLTWQLGDVELTSISSYADYAKAANLDIGANPAPLAVAGNDADTTSFTQELRLAGETDRMRWQVGGYFMYLDIYAELLFGMSSDSPLTTIFFGGESLEIDSIVDQQTQSYSAFGQMDYDLTDKLTFVAGLRFIQEEMEFQYDNIFFPNLDDITSDSDQPPIVTGFEYPSFTDDDRSDSLWAGKVQLEYKPNDDWLLYAGVNRGVKAGGYNNPINDFGPPPAPEEIPFDEEVLLAYEAGFKATLFDGKARLNGSVYYYDYSDYQAFLFRGFATIISNVDAETVGVELDLHARPAEGWDIRLSGSYVDAEIADFQVAPGVLRDVRPGWTPKWQFAGAVRYEWPTRLLGGAVALQMTTHYVSDGFGNIRNFGGQKFEDYTVSNVRASWTSADEQWEVAFYGRNIFDERYKTSIRSNETFCGCNHDSYGKPQWFGGQVRYYF